MIKKKLHVPSSCCILSAMSNARLCYRSVQSRLHFVCVCVWVLCVARGSLVHHDGELFKSIRQLLARHLYWLVRSGPPWASEISVSLSWYS